MKILLTLSPWDYDAVLFDLDGVLTKTARVHAAAWKKLFDGFLEQHAAKAGRIRGRDASAPLISLCVNGEDTEFVSGTTRIFRLTDETPGGRIFDEGSDQLDANDGVTAPTVAVNPALNHTE